MAVPVTAPETQKPHENRRACTFATLLQLLSSRCGDVCRVKKHGRLGEEDVIRIYKYRLSQRVLLAALAPIKAPLQCNYSESVTDYKLNMNRNALDSVRDEGSAWYASKRHFTRPWPFRTGSSKAVAEDSSTEEPSPTPESSTRVPGTVASRHQLPSDQISFHSQALFQSMLHQHPVPLDTVDVTTLPL